MSYFEFVTAADVWPFGLAMLLFLVITGLEIVFAIMGFAADFGLDLDVDIDLDVEVPDAGWLTRMFDWLGIGRVPYLISLAGFLFVFASSGLAVQSYAVEHAGTGLSWPLLAAGCAVFSIPVVALINRVVGRFWPKDVETSVVSQDALIGLEAEITLGVIAGDSAGQIKARDPNGTMHYVLAIAESDAERFAQGDRLLIVGRRGSHYIVRRHPFPPLPSEAS